MLALPPLMTSRLPLNMGSIWVVTGRRRRIEIQSIWFLFKTWLVFVSCEFICDASNLKV
ncbi:hypothetical protein Hanom_Chr12g01178591 [Helianthus anomalus]